MNILVVGPSDSIFTKEFCENVCDESSMKITILTQHKAVNYREFYDNSKINELVWPAFFVNGLGKQLFHIFRLKQEWKEIEKQVCEQGSIDIVHAHYVEPLHLFYFFGLWKNAKKKVLTFWGSDILQTSKLKKILL